MQQNQQQLFLDDWEAKSEAEQKRSPVGEIQNSLVKRIPLTRGKEVIIDESDFHLVAPFHWCLYRDRKRFYARSTKRRNGKQIHMLMHRLIMGAKKGQKIDHRDLNGLNNRRYNIRFATQSQNAMNTVGVPNKTGFKGVRFDKRCRLHPFVARIKLNGVEHSLGYFATAIEAAHAYNDAAIKKFGEFARLNPL